MKMDKIIDKIRADMSWYNRVAGKPVPPKHGLVKMFTIGLVNRGFRSVVIHRIAHRAHAKGQNIRAAVWRRLGFFLSGADISPAATIDGGFRMPHPQGIVIGAGVKIGKMVTVNQHVTLGGNFGKTDDEGDKYPTIGDFCWISTGAVVAGPVEIGDESVVGANSVVTRSIPANTIVSGAPSQILKNEPRKPDWRKK